MVTELPVYCAQECKQLHELVLSRLDVLESTTRDHAQRFDTAQSHGWKRLWFWLLGWPLTDWNADRPNWRPWNRDRRP